MHLNMTVENTGNIGIDLDVSVLPDNPQWAFKSRTGTTKTLEEFR